MKQKGSARLRALEFMPEDLQFTPEESIEDPDTHKKVVLTPANNTVGDWKLVGTWEQMVGRTETDKKGELRDKFYLSMKRSFAESFVQFALRYRT
jgi:hypothetical protein